MRRFILAAVMSVAMVSLVAGCADTKTPKGAIMSFFKAIDRGDEKKIADCLSFDRLLLEQMGEAYMSLPPEERANRIEEMRKRMVGSIISGKLSFLKGFEPVVDKEEIKADQARVLVHNRKKTEEKLAFYLALEGGVWKIFSISGA
ncbi:MAG: hypothetical protein HZA22_11815 [Nitrospirae bacterium]|nr:hypothetical protein [Nitrospirota bacterium]MBI5696457.1 hypothetical protein [Nitrospirota bacterium]